MTTVYSSKIMGIKIWVLTVVLVGLITSVCSAAYGPPWLVINGDRVPKLVPNPVFVSGNILVGARSLFALIGGRVEVYGDSVRIYRGGHTLEVKAGQKAWYLDGKQKNFSIAPMMYQDSIMVPVAGVVLNLGGKYNWDEGSSSAMVDIYKENDTGGGYYPGQDGPYQNRGHNYLEVVVPRSGETVYDGDVEFGGLAASNANVRVRVRSGNSLFSFGRKVVAERTARADDRGNWRLYIPLNKGVYRADVELLAYDGRATATRQVKFAVDDRGYGSLSITSPADGARVDDNSVSITGRAPADADLRLMVYNPAGERIEDQGISANRNGSWSRRVSLSSKRGVQIGTYRIVVTLLGRQNNPQVERQSTFFVRERGQGQGYGLEITRPYEGQTLTSTTVNVGGSAAPGARVLLQIFRSRDRVYDREFTVNAEGSWGLNVALGAYGAYRIVAQDVTGGRVQAERQSTFFIGDRAGGQGYEKY